MKNGHGQPVTVPMLMFKEGTAFIAYCPSLDLSTCGRTFDQAYRRFQEVVELFFEDISERGTLAEVLTSCGWRLASRPKPHWVPPQLIGNIEREVHLPVTA